MPVQRGVPCRELVITSGLLSASSARSRPYPKAVFPMLGILAVQVKEGHLGILAMQVKEGHLSGYQDVFLLEGGTPSTLFCCLMSH